MAACPLLVLCEDNPTEATVRREVELIIHSPATPTEQADLLAFALRVGARDLPRAALERIFREMLPMVRGATIVDDWIAEGEARGEARGETRGREEEARQMALRLLRRRFGKVSASMVSQVERLTVAECETLAERLIDGIPLEQLLPG